MSATGKPEASGLLLHSGWLSANELTTRDFFWWYRMREVAGPPAEEFAARYASPDPNWNGAFFPVEELEAAVEACFGPEYDPACSAAGTPASMTRNTAATCSRPGGTRRPAGNLRWTADGDSYTVTYEVPDMTRRMTLTARRTDDGFRYLSCLPEGAILTEEEAGELVTGVLGQLRIFPEEDGSFHDNGTGVLLLGERWESPAELGGRELLFWLRCNGFPVESRRTMRASFRHRRRTQRWRRTLPDTTHRCCGNPNSTMPPPTATGSGSSAAGGWGIAGGSPIIRFSRTASTGSP